MPAEQSDQERCPYCGPPYEGFTDDHVFPQFLGGRRTIRVCRRCNNTFGHTFEGGASKQLARLQVFISHFGLNLTRNPAIWSSALMIDDEQLDLTSGPDGVQYRLSKPIIRTDQDGNIIGGKARSTREANSIARGLIESGKATEVEITPDEASVLEEMKLVVATSFDDNLFRFSTKLAAALAIASGYRDLISSSGIPAYLHGRAGWLSRVAFCDVKPLIRLKPPLAHTVYIELGEKSYGIVLIFGYQKIFVPLPSSAERRAILASLDPLTGEESFADVDSIGPRDIPATIQKDSALAHLQSMLDTLTEDAVLRGAKKKPELSIRDVDLGAPMPSWWSSSTVRYMFPDFPRR